MVDKDILFVFGAPRSGTTFLNDVLRRHFDYGLCAEGKWVLREGSRVQSYGDLRDDANLRRLIATLQKYSMFKHFRTAYSERFARPMELTADRIIKHMPERSYAGLVYAVFQSVAEQMGKRHVGNKYPDYWKDLEQLDAWFPNALFLHVVRDGRDVALSVRKQNWGERTTYGSARRWVQVQKRASSFFNRISAERRLVLYYEELCASPDRIVDRLDRFLSSCLVRRRREAAVEDIQQRVKRGNYQKWRKEMPKGDICTFEAVAADWLRKHGYPTVCDSPRVSAGRRLFYETREWTGKAVVAVRKRAWNRYP